MNDYYQKYIKYKTKYFEIKYGGSGTSTKLRSWAEVVKSRSALSIPQQPQPQSVLPQAPKSGSVQPAPKSVPLSRASVVKPLLPVQLPPPVQPPPLLPPPPSTPPMSTKPPPVTPGRGLIPGLTPGSTVALPPTPKLEIDSQTVESIIKIKDKILKLLKSCIFSSNYVIIDRIAVNGDFYINFYKKREHTSFAHLSFHNPTDSPSTLKLNDMFDINAFHLRYDDKVNIFFNLRKYDNERLILQSPMKEEEIIALIGCENYYELIKIKNCLEETLNRPKIRQNITDPVAKKLNF